jgi:acyl-CoA dehydrogenase
MNFEHSAKVEALRSKLQAFMDEHVYPNENLYWEHLEKTDNRWQAVPIIEQLKPVAKAQGLWNLFLPETEEGAGLTNLEYAPLAEIMGRVGWASEVFNCSPPDTGNMEVLHRYGTQAQQERWLKPLLAGEIRSAFCMTEPDVASSDATNIQTRMTVEGDELVINGTKWWSSGAGADHCALLIVMGKSDPENPNRYEQQTQVLVPIDTPGIHIKRMLPVFGYDDAPHGHAEIEFTNVRVPLSNVLLGLGRGFEIAQGRLGPGRIHHCMRNIGQAERALEKMCLRVLSRTTFGKRLSDNPVIRERVANSRIMINQARLLVLHAADKMDRLGNKEARSEIAMAKVAAPAMLCQVLDWAIQAHGAAGVTVDFGLAYAYARARTMRIVDGPDEVHRDQLGRSEIKKFEKLLLN